MVHISADNKFVENALEKLVQILQKNDAYFHDDITIKCENNQFSIIGAAGLQAGQAALFVPEHCFVSSDQINFSIKDDTFLIENTDENLSADQVEIAELITALYNKTDKLGDYIKNSVLSLYYEEQALFSELTLGRDFSPLDQDMDKTFLHHFLSVRGFTVNRTDPQGRPVFSIPPVIEYLNHHPEASSARSGCNFEGSQHRGMLVNADCARGDGELLISYMHLDAQQLFWFEGYLEPETFFVQSIPLDFEIPGHGTVKIYTKAEKPPTKSLPVSLRDLAFYHPLLNASTPGLIELGFIFIPQTYAGMSMRRILTNSLQSFTTQADELEDIALYAEHMIIKKNLEFYQNSLSKLGDYRPSEKTHHVIKSWKDMMRVQIDKIKSYPFYEQAISYQGV